MTQTQNRRFAYICACISVFSSFVLWTALVAQMPSGGRGVLQEGIWEGKISDSGVSTASQEAAIVPIEENLHLAPPPIPSVLTSDLTGQVGVEVQRSEAETGTAPSDREVELRHWELQQMYTLDIPAIDVRTPVYLPSRTFWDQHDWDQLEEQMQIGLHYGAVAYPHSSSPQINGTMIIAGHSSPPTERAATSAYGDLFRRLPELAAGDTFEVTQNGSTKRYIVQGKTVVSPSETSILRQQSDKKEIKLITCYPIGTTKDRMIISAVQADELAVEAGTE